MVEFRTDRARHAYEEMKATADRCKAEVIEEVQHAMNEGADFAVILQTTLSNSNAHAQNMALALETAMRIDRDEYAFECAIHDAYKGGNESH